MYRKSINNVFDTSLFSHLLLIEWKINVDQSQDYFWIMRKT